jgi:hypothetical protein
VRTPDIAHELVGVALLVIGLAAARRVLPFPIPKWSTVATLFAGLMVVGGIATGESAPLVLVLLAGLPAFGLWWWRRGEPARRELSRRRERAALAVRRRAPPPPGTEL